MKLALAILALSVYVMGQTEPATSKLNAHDQMLFDHCKKKMDQIVELQEWRADGVELQLTCDIKRIKLQEQNAIDATKTQKPLLGQIWFIEREPFWTVPESLTDRTIKPTKKPAAHKKNPPWYLKWSERLQFVEDTEGKKWPICEIGDNYAPHKECVFLKFPDGSVLYRK